jgi:ribosomal protein L2
MEAVTVTYSLWLSRSMSGIHTILNMLQTRLLVSQPLQHQRCLHTLSRRFHPTDILHPSDAGKVTKQALVLPSQPSHIPEEKNAAILRTYKPRTPGLRHLKRPINDHLYKGRPYLPLTMARKGQHIGGRNSHTGKITVRHRGAGAKRRIRTLDYQRMDPGKHLVERIEHDPGRSAHIALLSRTEGQTRSYSYIVAPQGMRAGEVIESYRQGIPDYLIRELGGTADAGMIAAKTAFRGNCMPLHMIPPGTIVYNVGLRRGKGAQLCRSAGTFATVLSKGDGDPKKAVYVDVKLKSGEVRRIHRDCCATIGTASNVNFNRRQLGKAGRKRWLGIRPTVRGVAMNASEHPHGGGRGKSKGNVHPVSIWGQLVSSINDPDLLRPLSKPLSRPRAATRPEQNRKSTDLW